MTKTFTTVAIAAALVLSAVPAALAQSAVSPSGFNTQSYGYQGAALVRTRDGRLVRRGFRATRPGTGSGLFNGRPARVVTKETSTYRLIPGRDF